METNELKKFVAGLLETVTNMANNKDAEYDRIIFIGAHGTGKSTLAKELSNIIGIPVVESVAREFFKNWKYLIDTGTIKEIAYTDKQLADIKQNILCSMSRWDYMRWVEASTPVIMTRCPLDTLAYALADDLVSLDVANTNLKILKEHNEFCESLKNSLFIYLPIEFSLENDGVRPMGNEYQKKVDEAMRDLLYKFGITPLVVTGSVDERVKQVMVKIAGEEMANLYIDTYKKLQK